MSCPAPKPVDGSMTVPTAKTRRKPSGIQLNGVPPTSPVQLKLEELELACERRGFTLSRWQSNKSSYRTEVTYAVHTGERKSQFRYMPKETVITYVYMGQREGSTEKCEAYKTLSKLLKEVDAIPPALDFDSEDGVRASSMFREK